ARRRPPVLTARRSHPRSPAPMIRTLRTRPRLLAAALMTLATAGVALAQQALKPAGELVGHAEPVYAIAWTPDGKAILTGGFDNTVRIWDASSKKELKRFEGHTSLVLAVAPSPDGQKVLSGSLDK